MQIQHRYIASLLTEISAIVRFKIITRLFVIIGATWSSVYLEARSHYVLTINGKNSRQKFKNKSLKNIYFMQNLTKSVLKNRF